VERAERSGGLHKRGAEAWGNPLWARGAALLSVLSTCVTKQTGDMVYSEARRLRMLGIWARTTMLYALERESDHGSTSSVFVELSERGDVRSGPVPRKLPEFAYPKGLLLRRVNNSGDISWHKSRIFISEVFRFEELAFELITPGSYRVFFRDMGIGELNVEELRFTAARRVV
jgi:hypothetical protein